MSSTSTPWSLGKYPNLDVSKLATKFFASPFASFCWLGCPMAHSLPERRGVKKRFCFRATLYYKLYVWTFPDTRLGTKQTAQNHGVQYIRMKPAMCVCEPSKSMFILFCILHSGRLLAFTWKMFGKPWGTSSTQSFFDVETKWCRSG